MAESADRAQLPPAERARATALPLAGLVLGVAYTLATVGYPVGNLVAPGAGLFPLFAGLLIVASSVVGLIGEYRRPTAVSDPPGPAFWRVPALAISLIVYFMLLKPAGFLIAAAALSGLVLAVLGRRPWSVVLAIALATSVASSLAFRLLGVPLPAGILSLG